MKHYLITGGTGMVGSHLVNEIKQTDAHITILTRQDKTRTTLRFHMSIGQKRVGKRKFQISILS